MPDCLIKSKKTTVTGDHSDCWLDSRWEYYLGSTELRRLLFEDCRNSLDKEVCHGIEGWNLETGISSEVGIFGSSFHRL